MHKANQQDPQVMPAKTVYEMATSLGAQAIGLSDAGVLKEGNLADVITVSLEQPTPVNEKNVYDQIVLFTNPQNVKNVFVNGRQLKKDGKMITIDPAAAKEKLREATQQFWQVNERE